MTERREQILQSMIASKTPVRMLPLDDTMENIVLNSKFVEGTGIQFEDYWVSKLVSLFKNRSKFIIVIEGATKTKKAKKTSHEQIICPRENIFCIINDKEIDQRKPETVLFEIQCADNFESLFAFFSLWFVDKTTSIEDWDMREKNQNVIEFLGTRSQLKKKHFFPEACQIGKKIEGNVGSLTGSSERDRMLLDEFLFTLSIFFEEVTTTTEALEKIEKIALNSPPGKMIPALRECIPEFSEVIKNEHQGLLFMLTEGIEDGDTQCFKCGGRKIKKVPLQTSRADEGTTWFHFCLGCCAVWKIR